MSVKSSIKLGMRKKTGAGGTVRFEGSSIQLLKAGRLKIAHGEKMRPYQAPYEVRGFRLFDRVLFRNSICFVTDRRASGYFALRTLDGTRVHDSAKAADITLLEMRKGYIQERGTRQFLPAL